LLTNSIAYFISLYSFARQYYSNLSLAAVFGYDQNSWDKGKEVCPDWCKEDWTDLTEEQQWAAWVFGYDEDRWNSS
jgi:hypothetical protein